MFNDTTYVIIEWFLLINIFILSVITYIKSNKNITNNSIVFVFVSFIIHLLFNISILTGYIEDYTFFIFIDEVDGYIFAIAIVHHIMDVTKVKVNVKLLYIIAVISSIISFIYYYIYLSSDIEIEKTFIESLESFNLSNIFLIPMFLIFLNNAISAVYLVIILIVFKKRVENYLSDNITKTKQYLNSFILIYISLIFSYTIFVLFFSSKLVQFGLIPTVVYFFFFITTLIYMGIPIVELNQNIVMSKVNNDNQQKIIDYTKLKQNIEDVITNKQLYKDPNFTLFDLARELSVNSKQLSVFLNKNLKTNFSTYINMYRVNEVKRLLCVKEYEKFTLEAIAELVGFNNRITFYRVFKKIEKISPSDYKSQCPRN